MTPRTQVNASKEKQPAGNCNAQVAETEDLGARQSASVNKVESDRERLQASNLSAHAWTHMHAHT